jgi:predicted DCC family thiol-disulfide oxidoreductase YuxK
MTYNVIYDGNCNLCVTLVQFLENLDKGQLFQYIPMQDKRLESLWNTPQDCEMGDDLIDGDQVRDDGRVAMQLKKLAFVPMGSAFVDASIALYLG